MGSGRIDGDGGKCGESDGNGGESWKRMAMVGNMAKRADGYVGKRAVGNLKNDGYRPGESNYQDSWK